ncbi:hypothetical protein E4T56_gene18855, partial [Termitomyces sp. T112]
MLALHLLQHLPTPILLKLFNSDPTSTKDIIHCPPLNSNVPNLNFSSSGATHTPTIPKDNQEKKESAPPPQSPLNTP